MDHSVCQSHENHGASCLCKLHAMLMLVLIIFHQVARGPLIFHVQMERRQWAYGSCRMVILHIANSCRTWPRNFYSWPKALLWLFCATSVVSAKMDPGYLLGMFFFSTQVVVNTFPKRKFKCQSGTDIQVAAGVAFTANRDLKLAAIPCGSSRLSSTNCWRGGYFKNLSTTS